jgi:hypothetical protein
MAVILLYQENLSVRYKWHERLYLKHYSVLRELSVADASVRTVLIDVSSVKLGISRHCYKAGVSVFLSLPLLPEPLVSILNSHCSSGQASESARAQAMKAQIYRTSADHTYHILT